MNNNNNNNKNDNKSVFLYAILIFVVAILLIILSFFGQTNLKNNQPVVDDPPVQETGIAEKAAVLSEENKALMEENMQLKAQNEALLEKQTANDLLLSANGYMTLGNMAKAGEMLDAVQYELLTSDQKIIYDNIKNKLN